MSSEDFETIPSKYDPKVVEEHWLHFWLKNNFYNADNTSTKPSFSMVMPPPNVTGILHMGHVLGNTLQDILARYKRMQGYEVLWLPGTDHAGIATQTVVERDLIKRTGKRRVETDRASFEALCWQWSKDHQTGILDQIKRLGCSCDFSRLSFTLDPKINHSVLQLFKKLYDDKLIYQGYYLVHWDPVTQTALADDEVEYEEKKDAIYFIKYPFEDGSNSITVATTRPETLLGDTAVAVSPKDSRYSNLIGQKVKLPLTDRLISIIADHHVDPEFGTGAVKITPAHDFNDYEMAKRHDLSMINIMTTDGKINSNGGAFEGLSMADARVQVVKKLKEMGLLVKIESHIHRVGTSYRSKAIIEPFLSKQWFIRMEPFKAKLREAVEQNQVKLIPDNWKNTYFHWIDNLRDWCISRQLWWGHRIPIWYHKEDPNKIICHIEKGLPKEIEQNPDMWRQEDDVLDTWFSSGLWPFSTLGWPEQSKDLKKFYPNSLLVTGNDILFFWVARMMMMGHYALNQFPFSEVILTGLIYGKSYWRKNKESGGITYVSNQERMEYDLGKAIPDEVQSKWEKISKSKGNAIDPREMSELYGTCAMRMALASTSCQLRQIDLDRRRFEDYKNFANKVWNGARFVLTHLSSLKSEDLKVGVDFEKLLLADRWILVRLTETITAVTTALDQYQFDIAAQKAYEFYWNEFCAYYLEIVKPYLFDKLGTNQDKKAKIKVLLTVLVASIRLLHPMAPFITEELFQTIKKLLPSFELSSNLDVFTHETLAALQSKSCMIAPFPKAFDNAELFEKTLQDFNFLQQLIYTIRNIRGEMKLSLGVKTDIYFEGSDLKSVEAHLDILKALVPIDNLFFNQKCSSPFFSSATFENISLSLPMPKELLEVEVERLLKEEQKKIQSVESLQEKLNNPSFIERAPLALVEKQKSLLMTTGEELQAIREKIKALRSL